MPRLKNTDVMSRSGGAAYNPGGHRGRSGDNGAGNHRYDPKHKALLDEIDEEIKLRKKKTAARAAAEKRFARNAEKLDAIVAEQSLTLLGSRRQQLTVDNWNEKPLSMKCSVGAPHVFEVYPSEVIQSRAKTVCPKCSNLSKGKPRADARLKYHMRLDEQGMVIKHFLSMGRSAIITDKETQEHFEVKPKHVDRWKRSKDDRIIRFVADEDDHVFVFRGRKPSVSHPFIAHLLATCPVEEVEGVRGKPITGIDSMERVIKQFLDEGDKVVNLSLNPAWLGNSATNCSEYGTYAWGEIPQGAALAKYMKTTKETWQ